MKSTVKAVVLLTLSFALFGAVLAHAQNPPLPTFQHVIVVIQENRTPDNLFGGVPGTNGLPPFESGADLAQASNAQQWCLGACFDPGHENPDWQSQHASGVPGRTPNPGQCGQTQPNGGNVTYCNAQPVCNSYGQDNWVGCSGQYGTPISLPAWPEESYVAYTLDMTGTQHVLDPYVSIATQYGFANYFYQTNQGASQPAHDFLLGGTSASTGTFNQSYYNWFAADNLDTNLSGCEAASGETVPMIDPDGNLGDQTYGKNGVNLFPCFDHNTLVDLLTPARLSWKYYTNHLGDIWTAPNGIAHICYGPNWSQSDFGTMCNYSEFTQNVITPDTNFLQDDFHGGGTNINVPPPPGGPVYCNLPNVAWIIPDGTYSDHPGVVAYSTHNEGGPNWVASIINAVGQAQCVEPPGPFWKQPPWNDTVIFVVWDDWGGWYDHVMEYGPNGQQIGTPYEDNYLQNGQNLNDTCSPTYTYDGTNYWGCGYTYGFRVPFLVVSAYTPPGYVSGGCASGPNGTCYPPNGDGSANADPYRHDFGSILAFIEYNFKLGMGCINSATDITGTVNCNNGNPGDVPFADYFAPELQYDLKTGAHALPLGDFFGQTQYPFTPITTVNNSFIFDYFYNFNGPFTDPDNDVIDQD